MEVKIKKKGNGCIGIGTKKGDYSTVVIWYDNPLIDSDVKSELSAIAVAEIIREHLQVYVDIHSRSEPKYYLMVQVLFLLVTS